MGIGTHSVSLVRFICDRERDVNRKFFNNRVCTLIMELNADIGRRDVKIVIPTTSDK
ncbi:hypothetical protein FIU95_06945 [Microbulbifer sp. THAF38]|nr:hypothetical protein FIU95_06945 [Microbulbifer sp. THAF38]